MAVTHETLGAHIRNILGPYANLVCMLEEIYTGEDDATVNHVKNYLLTKMDVKELRKNLNHFIEVSHLDEVEDINWRATPLCEKYYAENE